MHRRWNMEEKAAIVREVLTTNALLAEGCRKYNVSAIQVCKWKETFLLAGRKAMAGTDASARERQHLSVWYWSSAQGMRQDCQAIKSSHYWKPVGHSKRHLDIHILQSIENIAIEHPSYGVPGITVMLHRAGIAVSRKKVYLIMKLANLARMKSVTKHAIVKRMLAIPDRPGHSSVFVT